MLPVCIWLAGWFERWLGLPAVALPGAGLWPALAGSWRGSQPRPAVVACALLALGWVMLTAAGGVFDGGNGDWLEHRTMLLDPGRQPWPAFLPDVLSDHLPSESNPVARPSCLAGPLAALLALYLTSGSLDFPSGWMWERHNAVLLALWIPVVYLTEFGALALLLWVLRPELSREPFFVAGVATLLLLPWVFFGAGNDLLMRGGMPALLLLCYYCVDVIARDGREIARAGPNLRRFALAGVIMVLCVGALTPGIELARAIGDDVAFRYERSGYTTFALPIQWQHQNTAREIPDLLRRLLRKVDAGPRREKAEPVVRAGFDVYLNGNERWLVYVKEHCRQDDLESVVLEVVRSDAPPEESVVAMRSMGDACGALRGLPGGAVAAIRTGQRRQGEDDWMVEIRFDEAGRMVKVNRE